MRRILHVTEQAKIDYDRRVKQAWYQKNRERILQHYAGMKVARRATTKQWASRYPERLRASVRKFRETAKGREYAAHQSLIRRFREHGLTLDQYHAIAEQQDFCCAICREEPQNNYGGSHDGFHIDHHHVTSRVRGLLCDTCNVGIGMLKDSVEVCSAAATYLARP